MAISSDNRSSGGNATNVPSDSQQVNASATSAPTGSPQQQWNNSSIGGRKTGSCSCFTCASTNPNACKILGVYCAQYGCGSGTCSCQRRLNDDSQLRTTSTTQTVRGLTSNWQLRYSTMIANGCTVQLQALATQFAEMSPPNNCLGDNTTLTCYASAFA